MKTVKEGVKPANWDGWLESDHETPKQGLKRLSHKRIQKHWNKKMDAAQVSLGKKYAKEHGLKKEDRDPRLAALEKQSNAALHVASLKHEIGVRRKQANVAKVKKFFQKEETVNEVLSPSMGVDTYVHDFVHSKDKRFKGKNKKQRIKMALGAYYGAQRNEETMTKKIDEAKKYLGDPAHAGGYISALRGNQPFNNPHKKGSSKAKRWFKGLITAKLKKAKVSKVKTKK